MSKNKSLKEKLEKEVRKELMEEYKLKSPLAVPKISKVVVNLGTSDTLKNKDIAERMEADVSAITGQKPSVRKARISVAGFGIREGNPVGLSVTLRKDKMYSFLERLISVVLPRLRDFRGLPRKSFDQHGNYTIGLSDYGVFPEIDLSKADRNQGMEITIVTDTKDVERSRRLLELIGIPFEKEE